MKRTTSIISSLIVLALLLAGLAAPAIVKAAVIPTITIVKVDPGKTVTIQTNNYPANDNFDVLMNTFGTKGVGGTKVDTVSSKSGGSLSFTFNIPASLANEKTIAIRLQSPSSGYYSYNWFVNKESGIPNTGATPTPTTGSAPSGTIPTISITKVEAGKTVSIQTNKYPANDSFEVLMGKFGTRGVGGTKVDTVASGAGGTLTFTFNIPAALVNEKQIAIRLQSPKSGYYSYDWFWNNTSSTTPGVPPTGGDKTATPRPTIVVPTFTITGVATDSTVTIQTKNFPANDSFDVYMGEFGTRGVGGTKVDTIASGSGGTLTFTFNIPAAVKGDEKIAIRLQSPTSGYYSYNWFWNSTAP